MLIRTALTSIIIPIISIWLTLYSILGEAAGIQQLFVSIDEDSPKLEGAVWYPCDLAPETVKLGRIEVPGVKDCELKGSAFPLIVFSHGARGWFGGHHDTATALADAGYVVAAITHPDKDRRSWRSERPQAIKVLVDYMLKNWSNHAQIDSNRIGFFGFSRGGYTGLVLVGGKPDFKRIIQHCEDVPTDSICKPSGDKTSQRAQNTSAQNLHFTHDPRIKAAVIAAPVGIVFSPEGLRHVEAAIQLWRSENDELLTYPYNAEAVYQALPVKPDYRVVPRAGHFAFLAPCNELQLQVAPQICKDSSRFGRVKFHQTFNSEIIEFFQKHLNQH